MHCTRPSLPSLPPRHKSEPIFEMPIDNCKSANNKLISNLNARNVYSVNTYLYMSLTSYSWAEKLEMARVWKATSILSGCVEVPFEYTLYNTTIRKPKRGEKKKCCHYEQAVVLLGKNLNLHISKLSKAKQGNGIKNT